MQKGWKMKIEEVNSYAELRPEYRQSEDGDFSLNKWGKCNVKGCECRNKRRNEQDSKRRKINGTMRFV